MRRVRDGKDGVQMKDSMMCGRDKNAWRVVVSYGSIRTDEGTRADESVSCPCWSEKFVICVTVWVVSFENPSDDSLLLESNDQSLKLLRLK